MNAISEAVSSVDIVRYRVFAMLEFEVQYDISSNRLWVSVILVAHDSLSFTLSECLDEDPDFRVRTANRGQGNLYT